MKPTFVLYEIRNVKNLLNRQLCHFGRKNVHQRLCRNFQEHQVHECPNWIQIFLVCESKNICIFIFCLKSNKSRHDLYENNYCDDYNEKKLYLLGLFETRKIKTTNIHYLQQTHQCKVAPRYSKVHRVYIEPNLQHPVARHDQKQIVEKSNFGKDKPLLSIVVVRIL